MDVQGVLLAFGSRVTMALVEQCVYWASSVFHLCLFYVTLTDMMTCQ
jgi:hypothetical protein